MKKTRPRLEGDTRVQTQPFQDGRWKCILRRGGKARGQERLRIQAREGIMVGVRTQEGTGFRTQGKELALHRRRDAFSIKRHGGGGEYVGQWGTQEMKGFLTWPLQFSFSMASRLCDWGIENNGEY